MADIHRAFSVLGCDLFGLKPVASPVPHRAQQVRCPAVSGGGRLGGYQERKGPWRAGVRQILRAEARLGAWACSVWRRYSEENAGAGGHLGYLGTTEGVSRRTDVLEWMRGLLSMMSLPFWRKASLRTPAVLEDKENKARCCQIWLPGQSLGTPPALGHLAQAL